MKTKQYKLYLEVCENIIFNGEITKKQYDQYIKQMQYNLTEETAETKAELIEEEQKSFETHDVHFVHYNVGASYIILSKFECKPGYCFKK